MALTDVQVCYWRDPMDEATARRVLGSDHFDWSVQRGAIYCDGRAWGWWTANSAENFAAYNTAARVAQGIPA